MILVVQIALVAAVVVGSLALMRGGTNARHLAIRRILLLGFAATAAASVFFPVLLTRVARLLGIGRGTDLVLYALIVAFMAFVATAAQRHRRTEESITRLARRMALNEAPDIRSAVREAGQDTDRNQPRRHDDGDPRQHGDDGDSRRPEARP
jgi:hypothetical protein